MSHRTRIGLVAVALTLAACASPTAPSASTASGAVKKAPRPLPGMHALCTGGGTVGSGDHC